MTVMLMDPENSVELKCTKLKAHLLKERVLTCQLITQKTISDLRAKVMYFVFKPILLFLFYLFIVLDEFFFFFMGFKRTA